MKIKVLLAATVLVVTAIAAVAWAAADDDGDRSAADDPDVPTGESGDPVDPTGEPGEPGDPTDEPGDPVDPTGEPGEPGEPGDEFPVDQAREDAHGVVGMYEDDLPADVRVGRRGTEQMMLTEDYVLGRMTVELDDDGDGFRVTSVTVELPGGPETFELTPG